MKRVPYQVLNACQGNDKSVNIPCTKLSTRSSVPALPYRDPVTSALAIIPAYQAARTIGEVVSGLLSAWQAESDEELRVVGVNDGSTDATSREAARAGAEVHEHPSNRGKGAAPRSGHGHAQVLNAKGAVSLDAD